MDRFLNGLWVVSMNQKIATFDRDEFIEPLRERGSLSNFLLLENCRKTKEKEIYISKTKPNTDRSRSCSDFLTSIDLL